MAWLGERTVSPRLRLDQPLVDRVYPQSERLKDQGPEKRFRGLPEHDERVERTMPIGVRLMPSATTW